MICIPFQLQWFHSIPFHWISFYFMNTLHRTDTQSYRIQGCDAVDRAVYRSLNKILYLRILGSVEFSATRIVSVSNHLDASLYAISRVCMYDARWQEKHLFSEAPISLSASEPILTFRFVHNIFFSLFNLPINFKEKRNETLNELETRRLQRVCFCYF